MLSITPGTNPVVRCPKIWCWSSFTPPVSSVIKKSFEVIVIRAESGRRALYYFLSRFCRVLLTGVFVALRPKLAVRNVFVSAWRRYDAREMKCVRGSERKHTYVSFRPFPSASPRRSNALANRKRVVKTDPSLVGVRLGSVSRLRQLITIGELSTELCLSCVRDITADARRTREKPRLKAFALRGRARTPQVNEIQSSVVTDFRWYGQ